MGFVIQRPAGKKGPGRCGDYSPQLPQIRTCPTQAYGSSRHRLTCAVLPGGVTLTAPGAQSPRPVAHRQFHGEAHPSLDRVPDAQVPLPPTVLWSAPTPCGPSSRPSLSFGWPYHPVRLYSLHSGPTPAWGQGPYVVAVPPRHLLSRWSRRVSQVPREP